MAKKSVSVLLTCLMIWLAGVGAAQAPEGGPEVFRGNWELYSISLMGVTLNRSELSYNVVCNIHEDDTAAFALGESYFVAPVSYEADACVLHEGSEVTRLTLDEEGMLCLTMTSDGVKMNLRMQRAAASAPAEEIAPMVGQWQLESAEAMGLHLSPEDTGDVSATIYADHYGLLRLGEETLGLLLQAADGTVSILEEDGGRSGVCVDAAGRLVIRRQDGADGAAITLTLRRVPAEDEAVAASRLEQMEGRWLAVRTRVMGAELPLGAEVLQLEISGVAATLSTGGEQYAFTAAWMQDFCVLETEGIRCRCTIGEDGQLLLQIPVFDISFVLTRQTD